MPECPVCGREVPARALNAHVNRCLDATVGPGRAGAGRGGGGPGGGPVPPRPPPLTPGDRALLPEWRLRGQVAGAHATAATAAMATAAAAHYVATVAEGGGGVRPPPASSVRMATLLAPRVPVGGKLAVRAVRFVSAAPPLPLALAPDRSYVVALEFDGAVKVSTPTRVTRAGGGAGAGTGTGGGAAAGSGTTGTGAGTEMTVELDVVFDVGEYYGDAPVTVRLLEVAPAAGGSRAPSIVVGTATFPLASALSTHALTPLAAAAAALHPLPLPTATASDSGARAVLPHSPAAGGAGLPITPPPRSPTPPPRLARRDTPSSLPHTSRHDTDGTGIDTDSEGEDTDRLPAWVRRAESEGGGTASGGGAAGGGGRGGLRAVGSTLRDVLQGRDRDGGDVLAQGAPAPPPPPPPSVLMTRAQRGTMVGARHGAFPMDGAAAVPGTLTPDGAFVPAPAVADALGERTIRRRVPLVRPAPSRSTPPPAAAALPPGRPGPGLLAWVVAAMRTLLGGAHAAVGMRRAASLTAAAALGEVDKVADKGAPRDADAIVSLCAVYVPLADLRAPATLPLMHRVAAAGHVSLQRALVVQCTPEWLLLRATAPAGRSWLGVLAPPATKPPAAAGGAPALQVALGGLTALEVACLLGHNDFVRLYSIRAPPSPRLAPGTGMHALHCAVLGGCTDIIAFIAASQLPQGQATVRRLRATLLRARGEAQDAEGGGEDDSGDEDRPRRHPPLAALNAMVAEWAAAATAAAPATPGMTPAAGREAAAAWPPSAARTLVGIYGAPPGAPPMAVADSGGGGSPVSPPGAASPSVAAAAWRGAGQPAPVVSGAREMTTTLRPRPEGWCAVDIADAWGMTPLALAACLGNAAGVATLLSFGAAATATNAAGATPLHLALQGGSLSTALLLLLCVPPCAPGARPPPMPAAGGATGGVGIGAGGGAAEGVPTITLPPRTRSGIVAAPTVADVRACGGGPVAFRVDRTLYDGIGVQALRALTLRSRAGAATGAGEGTLLLAMRAAVAASLGGVRTGAGAGAGGAAPSVGAGAEGGGVASWHDMLRLLVTAGVERRCGALGTLAATAAATAGCATSTALHVAAAADDLRALRILTLTDDDATHAAVMAACGGGEADLAAGAAALAAAAASLAPPPRYPEPVSVALRDSTGATPSEVAAAVGATRVAPLLHCLGVIENWANGRAAARCQADPGKEEEDAAEEEGGTAGGGWGDDYALDGTYPWLAEYGGDASQAPAAGGAAAVCQ